MLNNQSLKYHCLKFAFIILVYWTAIPVFSQDIYKNRISIFYSPIHYFFDKTPISNGKVEMPANNIFLSARLHFIGGGGLAYERQIKNNNFMHFTINYYKAIYIKNNITFPQPAPVVSYRQNLHIEINYLRRIPIIKTFYLKVGGGLLYNHGEEYISVAKVPIYFPLENTWTFEDHLRGIGKKDLALNAIARLEYTPKPLVTFYTELTYNYTLFFTDQKGIKNLRQLGVNKFPSPHELAWRLGFGFNFGKGISKKQKQKVVE